MSGFDKSNSARWIERSCQNLAFARPDLNEEVGKIIKFEMKKPVCTICKREIWDFTYKNHFYTLYEKPTILEEEKTFIIFEILPEFHDDMIKNFIVIIIKNANIDKSAIPIGSNRTIWLEKAEPEQCYLYFMKNTFCLADKSEFGTFVKIKNELVLEPKQTFSFMINDGFFKV